MPEKRKVLLEFAMWSQALSTLLEGDSHLDLVEQVYLEQQILLVRLAYSSWRRRHNLPDFT